MAELFANGRIVDVALALVALEALALLGWRWRRGSGPAPASLLSNLTSGAALMLALRSALTDAGWPFVALCLLAALGAHGADMVLRWRAEGTTREGLEGKDPASVNPVSLGRSQTLIG